MLILQGIIRAATTLPGRTDKKTAEIYPARDVLQVEGTDSRGLVELYTLTVPDLSLYAGKVGEQISVPVRAWAKGAAVNLSYESTS
jgi:hypothetical protein